MLVRALTLLAMVLAGTAAKALDAPAGIPHELAIERAGRVSDLHYALAYTLLAHAPATEATEEIRFQLRTNATPLLLDFRDGEFLALTINGASASPRLSNGHIVLLAESLHKGQNTLQLRFRANVAAAQKAITRFEDKDDGSEYLYTLFVPMDASMAFPCFDQPDLKGRFTLQIAAPAAWTVISNTNAEQTASVPNGMQLWTFAETRPISTYLFAFAAGPFVPVHRVAGLPDVYVRKSKAASAQAEVGAVQTIAAEGLRYLSSYFAQPFPFPKYDMVLIPGFAFGGMEHAGATFLREESVLFRTAPTSTNLFNRDVLVLHELTHQWFGDFTTMRWFDDLWLKEGFAQYMAYQALSVLRPEEDVWKRFYQAIKPAAYAIDETQGTTPIYQDIPNLSDAKSAYGAIVYSKTPGVLKQLAFVLGEKKFQEGLQVYLAQHAYGNADWSDLIHAFESVSGRKLGMWAEMWIKHRGMPQVDVAWNCSQGKLDRVTLTQQALPGGDDLWPMALELALVYPDGHIATHRVQFTTRTADVSFGKAAATSCPVYLYANNADHAYGLFLLDAKSRGYVIEHVGETHDLFQRTLLWGSLWDSVRFAEFAPESYVRLVLASLPAEHDESLAASMIGRAEYALHHYVVSPEAQAALTAQLEALAADRMQNDPASDMRITWFRALPGVATQPAGRATLKALLDGSTKVPGVALRQQDRWGLVAALIAYGDPQADVIFESEKQRDPSGDGLKFAYIAEAAMPDAATKRRYFEEYLHKPDRPEDWIEGSLGAFNYWNQPELTQPYLGPALSALEQIKQTRKIFFLADWLNAFIGGQQSSVAQQRVRDYLQTAKIDRDLRLKILEAADELDRTVAIRAKFDR